MQNFKIVFLIFITSAFCFNGCVNLDKSFVIKSPSGQDGIYKINEQGKELVLVSDTSKTFILDSIPAISALEFESIRKVYSSVDDKSGVGITFTEKGKLQFEELTRQNIGKPIAVVINDILLTAPKVNAVFSRGYIEIFMDETTLDLLFVEKN